MTEAQLGNQSDLANLPTEQAKQPPDDADDDIPGLEDHPLPYPPNLMPVEEPNESNTGFYVRVLPIPKDLPVLTANFPTADVAATDVASSAVTEKSAQPTEDGCLRETHGETSKDDDDETNSEEGDDYWEDEGDDDSPPPLSDAEDNCDHRELSFEKMMEARGISPEVFVDMFQNFVPPRGKTSSKTKTSDSTNVADSKAGNSKFGGMKPGFLRDRSKSAQNDVAPPKTAHEQSASVSSSTDDRPHLRGEFFSAKDDIKHDERVASDDEPPPLDAVATADSASDCDCCDFMDELTNGGMVHFMPKMPSKKCGGPSKHRSQEAGLEQSLLGKLARSERRSSKAEAPPTGEPEAARKGKSRKGLQNAFSACREFKDDEKPMAQKEDEKRTRKVTVPESAASMEPTSVQQSVEEREAECAVKNAVEDMLKLERECPEDVANSPKAPTVREKLWRALDALRREADFVWTPCMSIPIVYAIVKYESRRGAVTLAEIEKARKCLDEITDAELDYTPEYVTYGRALIHWRMNDYKEALELLGDVREMVTRNCGFEARMWPSREDDEIVESTRSGLKRLVDELYTTCSRAGKPDLICKSEANCEENGYRRRGMYFTDPDMPQYVVLWCSNKCSIAYHVKCWQDVLEKEGCGDADDKSLREHWLSGRECFTPDCPGKLIKIIVHRADSTVKKRIEQLKKTAAAEKHEAKQKDFVSGGTKKPQPKATLDGDAVNRGADSRASSSQRSERQRLVSNGGLGQRTDSLAEDSEVADRENLEDITDEVDDKVDIAVQVERLRNERDQMTAELQEAKDRHVKAVNALKADITRLKSENDELMNAAQIATSKEAAKKTKEENDALLKRVTELTAQLKAAKENEQRAKEENRKLQNELAQGVKRGARDNADVCKLQKDVHMWKGRVDELEKLKCETEVKVLQTQFLVEKVTCETAKTAATRIDKRLAADIDGLRCVAARPTESIVNSVDALTAARCAWKMYADEVDRVAKQFESVYATLIRDVQEKRKTLATIYAERLTLPDWPVEPPLPPLQIVAKAPQGGFIPPFQPRGGFHQMPFVNGYAPQPFPFGAAQFPGFGATEQIGVPTADPRMQSSSTVLAGQSVPNPYFGVFRDPAIQELGKPVMTFHAAGNAMSGDVGGEMASSATMQQGALTAERTLSPVLQRVAEPPQPQGLHGQDAAVAGVASTSGAGAVGVGTAKPMKQPSTAAKQTEYVIELVRQRGAEMGYAWEPSSRIKPQLARQLKQQAMKAQTNMTPEAIAALIVNELLEQEILCEDEQKQSAAGGRREKTKAQSKQQQQQIASSVVFNGQASTMVGRATTTKMRAASKVSTESNQARECPICLQSLDEGRKVMYTSCEPMRHEFHAECFADWSKTNGGVTSTCPVCRQRYVSDEFPPLQ